MARRTHMRSQNGQIRRLKDLIAKLEEQVKGIVCEVCWTTSWIPIPTKKEADGVNTKTDPNGDLARCDYCWLEHQLIKQRGAARGPHAD
jgi:hypothetical protein